MINNKTVLAIIPARGGSKGLPGKNIRSLCGSPLLSYPIKTATQSNYIDSIIVSTDCKHIASVAENFGASVHSRPAELASDNSLVADTIRTIINETKDNFDYITLLEATSPIRSSSQVDNCIETLDSLQLDSVATFSELDPPPSRLWTIEENNISLLINSSNPELPRQKQQQAYYLNGIAYAFNSKKFISSNSDLIFFGNKKAIITDTPCVDIDTLDDFNLAEFLIRKNNEFTI